MPTVAELDVQIDAKDDATATILALDALIKGLDRDDVDIDIDANAGEVQAEIQRLLAQLRRLDAADPDIDVDIDTGGAAAELAKLRAELNAMRDETVNVRVNDKGVRRARTSMEEFRNSSIQASRSVNSIAAAVLGLGTALIPIGAVAAGGIMALVGALTAAGIGVGLFGVVAMTVFSETKQALKDLKKSTDAYNAATTDKERDAALEKTKEIMAGLDPATRGMVQAILDFKAAWRSFSMQFQPQIFQIAQEGLKGLATLFPSISPIVKGAADAFLFLERAAIRALQGPFWQSFFTMIGKNVGPIMSDLGLAIGNVIEGFAALVMAFMPMTRSFTGGMVGMTKAFADWAKGLQTNKGFQDFVAYVYEATPKVLALIGSLAMAFVALVQAGAPTGEMLLDMTNGLFEMMAAFQKAHPAAAMFGLALIGILAVSVKLLGPLLSIGKLFMVLGSALMSIGPAITGLATFLGIGVAAFLAVAVAIAAVVAGLIYAYTHFEGFRNLVNTVASAIAAFAVTAYNGIVAGLGAAASWLAATFGPAVSAVVAFVVEQFNRVRDWASQNSATFAAAWEMIKVIITAIWRNTVNEITTVLGILVAIWTTIWPTLSQIVQGAWEIIKGIISGALSIIMGIIQVFAGILAGDWSAIWGGIVLILKGIWQIIAGVVRGGAQAVQALINAFYGVLGATWRLFWAGIVSAAKTAWGLLRAAGSALWAALRAIFSTGQRGIQAGVNAFWSAVRAVFMAAMNGIRAGLSSFWSTLRGLASSAMSSMRSVIVSGWSAIRSAVSSAMSSIRSAISSGMSAAVSAVRGGMNNAIGAVTGMAGRFFSAGASLMASLGKGILSGVGAAVGAVKGAVGKLTALLPGSPAKTGPLSGQGYALIRGQHLSEDLAAGIASRAGLVGAASRDIADLMTLGLDSGAAFSAITRGVSAVPGQTGAASTTITIAPGAVALTVGDGVSPAEARQAFDGAGDQLADKLLTALRRQ
jgi:phage-related protein